ncbi:MAG: site-specific integrase [Nitrospirae bacterium]|nr:site-specific integrase [Nitrospirota bacterium]
MKSFSVNINGVTAKIRIVQGANGTVCRYKFRYPARRIGRQYNGTLGAADLLTRAVIRQLLTDRIQEVVDGLVANRTRLGEAIRLYFERHACHLTTEGKRERAVLEGFKSFIGDRPLEEITTASIDDYVAQRLSAIAASTVNRELTTIKAMFGKAVRWGLCKANPSKEVKKLREAPGRVRYLVEDEWPKLVAAAKAGPFSWLSRKNNGDPSMQKHGAASIPWWLYPACILARYVGLRRGEILRLTWQDVDLANALIRIQNTKANRNDVVPLSKPVIEMLWGLPRGETYIFPTSTGTTISGRNFDRAWRSGVKLAGITNLRFHDLRHDFGSRIVMTGYGIEAARVLLRHADLRMAARYTHLSPGYLRNAIEAIDKDPLYEKSKDTASSSGPFGGNEVVTEGYGVECDRSEVLEKIGAGNGI